jgi:hypothetical protein
MTLLVGRTPSGAHKRVRTQQGRAVQVDSIKTRVESADIFNFQRLKLSCDELLSSFAFNFTLRRYC